MGWKHFLHSNIYLTIFMGWKHFLHNNIQFMKIKIQFNSSCMQCHSLILINFNLISQNHLFNFFIISLSLVMCSNMNLNTITCSNIILRPNLLDNLLWGKSSYKNALKWSFQIYLASMCSSYCCTQYVLIA
jgi:hypothetical protein